MKETKLLQHIHAKVEWYARRLLKEAGYTILPDLPEGAIESIRRTDKIPGEQGVSLSLSIVGYARRYDGWEYELTDQDWKIILSLRWDKQTRKLLKYLKSTGNKNLTATEATIESGVQIDYERSWMRNSINQEFTRNHLPYHLGVTHTKPAPRCKNGYPSMWRMFMRPVPRNS